MAEGRQQIDPTLRSIDRWIGWRWGTRKDKKVKLPLNPRGAVADPTAPSTWLSYADARKLHQRLGFVLADTDDILGIDLDDCFDPALEWFAEDEAGQRARDLLASVPGYAEVSPSGTGIKLWTRAAQVGTSKREGVEIYAARRFFTVTGQRVGDGRIPEDDASDAVREWAARWQAPVAAPRVNGHAVLDPEEAENQLLLGLHSPDWDSAAVERDILSKLSPDCSYAEWLGVGQALHAHFGADGLELWDAWSRRAPHRYTEGLCAEKWATFRRGGGLTLGSLLHRAGVSAPAAGAEAAAPQDAEVAPALVALQRAIAEARDLSTLEHELAPAVGRLPGVDRVVLEQRLQARAAALAEAKIPLSLVRGWCRAERTGPRTPPWAQGYVYCTAIDRFYQRSTGSLLTGQGFCATHNRDAGLNAEGRQINAAAYVLDNGMVPCVERPYYAPGMSEFFTLHGREYVNTYHASGVPESVPTPPALAQGLDWLFRALAPQDRDRALLLAWLRHNVEHPGTKIFWSPFIAGVPGCGKSLVRVLLAHAMGPVNVGVVSQSALNSNFTDWMVGCAVRFFEEVKQHGANRYEIYNRILEPITNLMLEVHPKGSPVFQGVNFTNYGLLSNYLDGVALQAGDRRLFVLDVPVTAEQVREWQAAGHYSRLTDAARDCPGGVRQWLLEQPYPAEFDPHNAAPITQARDAVIEVVGTGDQSELADILEVGGPGYGPAVVSFGHLRAALADLGLAYQNQRLAHLLVQLGYRPVSRRLRGPDGQRVTLYARHGVEAPEQVHRASLDGLLS